jgi:putative two-component system response regulator
MKLAAPADASLPRVLFASCDHRLREQVAGWLRPERYDCYTAANEEELWTLLGCGGFELLILDLTSGGLPGLELLGPLKAEAPDLVILAATPIPERRRAIAALERGAAAMLFTPLDRHELLLQVAHELSRGRLIRESVAYEQRLETEARERTADLRRREEELALRLVSASGYRDNETGAHIRRIGLYSGVMAEALGWPAGLAHDLRIAATMHDIGKIGVPDTILLKPGRLTPDEFEIIKRHTLIGAAILDNSDIPLLRMARDIALYHHEKWNGTGYPSGLHGEEIPECARLVAIGDVYDALSHARVYKPAYSEAETLRLMKAERGQHFDPRLFDCFLDLLPEFRRIRQQVEDLATSHTLTVLASRTNGAAERRETASATVELESGLLDLGSFVFGTPRGG